MEQIEPCNRLFSIVHYSGQKMVLRAFNFIRALTKALKYYYINRSLSALFCPLLKTTDSKSLLDVFLLLIVFEIGLIQFLYICVFVYYCRGEEGVLGLLFERHG